MWDFASNTSYFFKSRKALNYIYGNRISFGAWNESTIHISCHKILTRKFWEWIFFNISLKPKNKSFLSYRPRYSKIVFFFLSWAPSTPNNRELLLEIQESIRIFLVNSGIMCFLFRVYLLPGSGERALSYTQMGAVVGDRGLVLKQHLSSHKNDTRLCYHHQVSCFWVYMARKM